MEGFISRLFLLILGFSAICLKLCEQNKQPKQQTSSRKKESPSPQQSPSSDRSSFTSTVPSVQPKTEYSLILVVSATHASLIDSLKNKTKIDYDDCHKLYEATQYLCQDTKTNLKSQWDNWEQFIVQSGKESEYDIYLIKIELNQVNKNFEKDVNQLDRYDSFKELVDLAVNVQTSPQLQMEAYGDFEVYHR